jgi:hypothetical protein
MILYVITGHLSQAFKGFIFEKLISRKLTAVKW